MKKINDYLNKISYNEGKGETVMPYSFDINRNYENLFMSPTRPSQYSELRLTKDMYLEWRRFAHNFANQTKNVSADMDGDNFLLMFRVKDAKEVMEEFNKAYPGSNLTVKYKTDFWILNSQVKSFNIEE